MESLTFLKHEDEVVDPSKCIICQKTGPSKTTSSGNGRKRIREASEVREDIVAKRLKSVQNDDFCYHPTNECYKLYTLKSELEKFMKQSKGDHSAHEDLDNDRGNRSDALRSPPDTKTTSTHSRALREKNCIICDKKIIQKRVYKVPYK